MRDLAKECVSEVLVVELAVQRAAASVVVLAVPSGAPLASRYKSAQEAELDDLFVTDCLVSATRLYPHPIVVISGP
jgi:hypothetical protein